jgi:hypothetical protein
MSSKDWAKFKLTNIVKAQDIKSNVIRLYNDLVQKSSDEVLQEQVKKRIKKPS